MNIPSHAERVDFCSVFKSRTAPSSIVPDINVRTLTVECPSCKREHPDFPADQILTCECGLSMCCNFGMTYIWHNREACHKDKPGLPLCSCPSCDGSRRATMRRIFILDLNADGYLNGDLDHVDSRQRFEHGE